MEARFAVVSRNDKFLVIRDIGTDEDSCKSVTNDSDAVVYHLWESGLLESRRLLYYDSQHVLDEITHDGKGGFTGFAFFNQESLKETV